MTLEEFLKRDISQKEEFKSSAPKEKTKDLDKEWMVECWSKIKDCLVNLEQNFYKLAERNNLRVLQLVNQLIELLVCSWSKVFIRTHNYKIFIIAHYLIWYWEALWKEEVKISNENENNNEAHEKKTIFPICPEFHASLSEISSLIEDEWKLVSFEIK